MSAERQTLNALLAPASPPPCAGCGSEEHGHVEWGPGEYLCPERTKITTSSPLKGGAAFPNEGAPLFYVRGPADVLIDDDGLTVTVKR